MKHIKLFFLLILSIFVTTSYAAELTDAQKKFRDGVQQYLQSNGYSPYVDDSDNTLCFKKNGVLYWISVDEGNPFYVEFHRTGVKTQEKYNSNAVIIGNDITKMAKCVKAIKNTSTIGIVVEMFCHNASSFTKVFDRCYSVLNYGYDEADEDYSEIAGTTNAPFEYISGEVANVKYDNSVITHYGDPIYAYQTRFLKPKIKLDVKKAGTYDIYIKLFDAKGDLNTNSNSPSGYTTKTEIDVTQGIHEYPLVGRGLDEDGYWSAGNYKFEFYYDGKLLGKLNFKVN